MKLISTFKAAVLSLGAVAVLSAADAPAPAATAPEAAAPKFTEAQLLETFGWFVGRRIGMSELGFTPEQTAAVIKGIQESAAGKESPFKIEEVGPELDKFMQAKQAEYTAKLKAKSQGESSKFFTEIKAKKGVIALPSGLCYEIVKEGTGPFPKATDTVKVHYTGTLVDGKKFDSSVDRGEPAEFPLNGVIPGWTEGLQKINKGGKIKLYVPSDLAYGDQGRPPTIPPAATLIFDVELLDIKETPAPAAAPAEAGAPAEAAAPAGM
ncbi:MAG TPA: FKBP-type peptidyl-prolyl cis-trans isomerase [Rariglobus sp.]|jgi:FKBP-type peptidyl-prolyl cis-trans isomerase|nr:FKBP-type peptidyl-prolyl cis-trans isomerase [Rariglobus sp.]